MPGAKLLSSHRKAYEEMVRQIMASGDYVVNNQAAASDGKKLNIRAAQSFIWSQIPLNASNSTYLFNVKDGVSNLGNSGGILPGEVRLKDQDVFFTYALGFYLVCYNEALAGLPGRLSGALMTFPCSEFLPFSADLFALQMLWTMGRLTSKVNGEILTPAWDMGQHFLVPQTQQPYNWSGNPAWDQIDLSDDGFAIVEPNWIINGGNNNEYSVNYPNNYNNIAASLNQLSSSGSQMTFHLVMKWQGFLAQNVSSIMNNQTKKA